MGEKESHSKYIVLFLPWMFSLLFASSPEVSYLIAWLGSFFIFYISLSGKTKPLPKDRSLAEQIMRPIFIIQIIFAGYMCCTSIFYFLNVLGYDSSYHQNLFQNANENKLLLTAQCQRYYCLGHASFVSGILMFMKYPVKTKYHIENDKLAGLLLKTAIVFFPLSILFFKIPGLSQFYYQLSSLSFIAGTLALAFAIPLKKAGITLISFALYLFNFYQAAISGFKEPIIISVLVLGIFLYPNYKKIVMIVFLPVLVLLFVFLPAYVNSFRASAWIGDETTENATQIAIDATLSKDQDNDNWDFLVYRLSEIDMFTAYVNSTPSQFDYYGLQIIKQSCIAVIPRIFWPSKPVTEDLVMQRVYNAGVVRIGSNVSAKPAYIVDAYLTAGPFGIFFFLFIYGAIAQKIALKSEELFGGYMLGTALVFSGLFQIFWRGLSFEFIANSVVWSYVTMLWFHKFLTSRNILKRI